MIIGIVVGIVVLVIAGFYFLNFESEEKEIFCPNYDGNEQECLSHSECEWDAQENNCDTIGGMEEDNEDEDGEDEDDNGGDDGEEDDGGINQELEDNLPDTISNEICKKLPLTDEFISSNKYHCLAMVNNNAEFCEMIKVDNEEDIEAKNDKNICLAHANEDSSYCEKIEGQDANHVCYFMLAVSSENADFCSDIDYLDTAQENKEEKEECYFSFMSNLYQWGKSDEITAEICGHLEDEMEKTCLALKARDISMCGSDPNCLTYFEQPLSFCDEHPNFVSCMKDRAKTSKNVSICELLPQPDRDVCVGVYCTHTELDVNICDTIENIQKRQEFYVELAMNLGNR